MFKPGDIVKLKKEWLESSPPSVFDISGYLIGRLQVVSIYGAAFKGKIIKNVFNSSWVDYESFHTDAFELADELRIKKDDNGNEYVYWGTQ